MMVSGMGGEYYTMHSSKFHVLCRRACGFQMVQEFAFAAKARACYKEGTQTPIHLY